MRFIKPFTLTSVALLFILTSCSEGKGKGGGFPVPVIAQKVSLKDVNEIASSVGTLIADEQVDLQSKLSGTVEEILFEEGKSVTKGSPLISVDKSKRQALFDEAKAKFELAQANLKRSKKLYSKKTISSQEHDQAVAEFESAKATFKKSSLDLDDASITAPFDGITGARLVSPGQKVSEGQKLSNLVAIDPLKLEFSLSEHFIPKVAIGQRINFSVNAYPKKQFEGEVFFISPDVNLETRSILVKANVPNPNKKLKAGMFAKVSLILETRKNSVVVPESAVLIEKGKSSIFIVDKDSKAQKLEVELGVALPGEQEILNGLSKEAIVITEGTQKIGPGSKVSYKTEP